MIEGGNPEGALTLSIEQLAQLFTDAIAPLTAEIRALRAQLRGDHDTGSDGGAAA